MSSHLEQLHRQYRYANHKHRKRLRDPRKRALDILLFTLVVLVPLTGGVMLWLEIPIPALLVSAYTAVAHTIAGILFLLFTSLGVGGFGKASYFFSRTYYGKRWVSTREAKGNTFLIGGILLMIGILTGLLTIKLWLY